VNLAVALAAQQRRIGLLDADLFGPSVPRLMNLSGKADAQGK
jgi:ATP-binding protein involved in chromosome partitioning